MSSSTQGNYLGELNYRTVLMHSNVHYIESVPCCMRAEALKKMDTCKHILCVV